MSETKIMVLKVDLGCDRCRRKVKKLLCKIHGIVEQAFDDKRNEVVIKVKSSCAETIKAKICCNGGESIKSIDIKLDEKKKDEPKPPKTPCGGPCNCGCAHPPYYYGYMKLLPSNDGCSGSGCRCKTGCCSDFCPNRCSGCRCEFFIEESSSCTLM